MVPTRYGRQANQLLRKRVMSRFRGEFGQFVFNVSRNRVNRAQRDLRAISVTTWANRLGVIWSSLTGN